MIPLCAIQVIAIDALQVLDVLLVAQTLRASQQVCSGLMQITFNRQHLQLAGIPSLATAERGAGIAVMKRRQAGRRKPLAVHLAFDIGRMSQRLTDAGRGRRRGHPAAGVGRTESGVIVQPGNFPYAITAYVIHLVHTLCPVGAVTDTAKIGQHPPATLSRLSARVQVDHRLDVHVVVESVIAKAYLAHGYIADITEQVLTNAGLADEHTSRIVGISVIGEQLGHISP